MNCGPEEIAEAVRRLRGGGLVAFPTETVYGLGALALDASAVARVFEAKGRPNTNPLIVHVSSIAMAKRLTTNWTSHANTLAEQLWPGPLSLVLAKTTNIPDIVTAGGPTVAIRMPAHPVTLALIEALDEPLVGPSANISGSISPTSAEHVRSSFDDALVYVLDGGPCQRGIESTVVDVSGTQPRVLRPGLITDLDIASILGVSVSADSESDSIARSPGLSQIHYAPQARTMLVDTADLNASIADGGARVVAITHSGIVPPFKAFSLGNDPDRYAAQLYATLRDADALKPDLIAIESLPTGKTTREQALWRAISDRVSRASADRGKQ